MPVFPIQHRSSQPFMAERTLERPKPQGFANIPDQLEDRKEPEKDPPSLFKQFLFEPIFQMLKWVLRGIFLFIDLLRNTAFETQTVDSASDKKKTFLRQLHMVPSLEKLLTEFNQIYSSHQREQLYRFIGETHPARVSWREIVRKRGISENIALGRKLIAQNPLLLQKYLKTTIKK